MMNLLLFPVRLVEAVVYMVIAAWMCIWYAFRPPSYKRETQSEYDDKGRE